MAQNRRNATSARILEPDVDQSSEQLGYEIMKTIRTPNKASVRSVVLNGLCTGCGTCAGVCPMNAIVLKGDVRSDGYVPQINDEECTQCRICLECCPGWRTGLEALSKCVYGDTQLDPDLGKLNSCYIAHSKDEHVRKYSCSGGITSQILIHALEEGTIDGAVVTGFDWQEPLKPRAIVARTKAEIVAACGSKYCPVPVNLALKEIVLSTGNYAVVCLPCQMHGVRLAESRIKDLKDRIVLHIGLFCSHMVTFAGTRQILQRTGIREEDVKHISYRGSGWPGSMIVVLKNGITSKLPFIRNWYAYWSVFSGFFFTPLRCLMCSDNTNELADISLGDAWLPELIRNRSEGESIVIVRTREASRLMESMMSQGEISAVAISPARVKQSQGFSLSFKKHGMTARIAVIKAFGHSIPLVTNQERIEYSRILQAFLGYFVVRVSENHKARVLLRNVPLPLYRAYAAFLRNVGPAYRKTS